MGDIKPIETKYNGYKFRSRLEARWAVFFDAAKIPYQYEIDGFERHYSEKPDRYLPDFYLPESKTWVEVKGDQLAIFKDRDRFVRLHDYGGCLPGFCESYGTRKNATPKGLLLLESIPNGNNFGAYFHPIIQHHKGLYKSWMTFVPYRPYVEIVSNEIVFTLFVGSEKTVSYLESSSSESDWKIETEFIKTPCGYKKILDAYIKAREARFEHGESP